MREDRVGVLRAGGDAADVHDIRHVIDEIPDQGPVGMCRGRRVPSERRIITPVKSASVGLVQCSEIEVSVDESAPTLRPVTGPGAVMSLGAVLSAQPAAAKESINTTSNRQHDGRPARTRNLLTTNSLANTHDMRLDAYHPRPLGRAAMMAAGQISTPASWSLPDPPT